MSDSKRKVQNRQDSKRCIDPAFVKYGPTGLHKMLSETAPKISRQQIAEIFQKAECKRMSVAQIAAWLTERMGRKNQ